MLNIPMSYTDTISISELDYLFKMSQEYLKEKDEAQNNALKG